MKKQKSPIYFMQKCLDLAVKGRGEVSPNPMVGCVIVKNGELIAKGYHKIFGGAHAEINALRNSRVSVVGAAMYVNLEPCVHQGKTPPCVDKIISAGIKKVYVAVPDQNPMIAGRGIRKLRQAGIEVETGLLKEKAESLNEKFFAYMREGIPFVALKIAETLDGRIADRSMKSQWITGEEARREVHKLRSEYDAVLVGASTVISDNPSLTVRNVKGKNPVRVVLDPSLKTNVNAKIYTTEAAPTFIFTSVQSINKKVNQVVKLEKKGVQVFGIDNRSILNLRDVLTVLGSLGISSVLVEGGGTLFSAFLEKKLVKRIYCFVAPKLLGDGLSAITFRTGRSIAKPITLVDVKHCILGSDILLNGKIKY